MYFETQISTDTWCRQQMTQGVTREAHFTEQLCYIGGVLQIRFIHEPMIVAETS